MRARDFAARRIEGGAPATFRFKVRRRAIGGRIRAIVRAYEAEFGRGAVWREVRTMVLAAEVFAVLALDLVALSAWLGGGHG